MMLTIVVWAQSAADSGFFGSNEFRNALWTLGVALLGYCARQFYCLRDDVRDTRRDLQGPDGLIATVKRHGKQIETIERWRVALDTLAEVEQREHPEEDRRVGPRRKRDIVHEVIDEHARRITDEHSTEDER